MNLEWNNGKASLISYIAIKRAYDVKGTMHEFKPIYTNC